MDNDTDNLSSVEVKRIELLLDDTLKKLEFAMTVPEFILKQFELVKESLSSTESYLVQKAFHLYLDEGIRRTNFINADEKKEFMKTKSVRELEIVFNNYRTDSLIPDNDVYDVSNALQILYNQPKIKELILKHNEVSKQALRFIQGIKYLFLSNIAWMKLTPEEDKSKEVHLRKWYIQHEEIFNSGTLMQAQCSEEEKLLKKIKEDELKQWENKVEKLKSECLEYNDKLREEAKEVVALDWMGSEERQAALLEQIECDNTELEKMRNTFVDEENAIRKNKNQIEQELLTILQKYDKDMIKKHEAYKLKIEIFQQEKEQLISLQEKYDKQTVEYDILMEEKREYEEKVIEQKMYQLRCKMAARKIQRFYRKFRNILLLQGKREDGQKSKQRKKKTKV